MTLIKFSTDKLIRYDANKDTESVYVTLFYSDLKDPQVIRKYLDTSKIFYNSFNQVGKLGMVNFFELSEVYGISNEEKKSLLTKPKIKDEIIKEDAIQLSDSKYDAINDPDFDNMFKNF